MEIEEIQKSYQLAIQETIDCLKENFGDNFISLYLSGSIIYQKLIPFVSDIDGCVILKNSTSDANQLCKNISSKLKEKYPFINGFSSYVVTPEFIRKEFWCRFILKYSSKRIYGINIFKELIPDLASETVPSREYAQSRLSFIKSAFLPMLEGHAPENLFAIPLSPKLFVRKICQNVFILEGAYLLMIDNSFVGFKNEDVIAKLKEQYPQWIYLFDEVNDIITKPDEIKYSPDEYVNKIKDYIIWLISKIEKS
jgi:hypothetical protein